MLGTSNQKTPHGGAFNRFKSGAQVLAELKVDKKKKFTKSDDGNLGYTEGKGEVEEVLGKRNTRSSQAKE